MQSVTRSESISQYNYDKTTLKAVLSFGYVKGLFTVCHSFTLLLEEMR